MSLKEAAELLKLEVGELQAAARDGSLTLTNGRVTLVHLQVRIKKVRVRSFSKENITAVLGGSRHAALALALVFALLSLYYLSLP